MRRTKEKSEESEKAILDAAYNIFLIKGYSATNMSDIAKEIGMTRGVIYWHFKSKCDLFVSLVTKELDKTFTKANKIYQLNENLQDKLKKLLLLEQTGSRLLELVKTFLPASMDVDSKSRTAAAKSIFKKLQTYFVSFEKYLINEQKVGHIRKDINIKAFSVAFLMASGMLHAPNAVEIEIPLLAIRDLKRDEIADFIWNGLGSAFIEEYGK